MQWTWLKCTDTISYLCNSSAGICGIRDKTSHPKSEVVFYSVSIMISKLSLQVTLVSWYHVFLGFFAYKLLLSSKHTIIILHFAKYILLCLWKLIDESESCDYLITYFIIYLFVLSQILFVKFKLYMCSSWRMGQCQYQLGHTSTTYHIKWGFTVVIEKWSWHWSH